MQPRITHVRYEYFCITTAPVYVKASEAYKNATPLGPMPLHPQAVLQPSSAPAPTDVPTLQSTVAHDAFHLGSMTNGVSA